MLPGGTDPLYRSLLAGSHHPTSRIEIWRSGVRVDTFGSEGLPNWDGTLSATLTSQVSRQFSFSVAETLYPGEDDAALLAPWGNEVRAFMGIKPGAGVPYEFQVFRGRINTVNLEAEGTVSVSCVDRGGDVNDAGFLGPAVSQVGNVVTDEFRRVVNDGVLDATFGVFDVNAQLTPLLTWEWDRGGACDDLATAVAGYWYALGNGDYVLRQVPWTKRQTILVTLRDGPGGELYTAVPSLSRANVFNGVIVTGEQVDTASPPVFAVVQDFDPASRTYWGGPFGRKTKQVNAQGVTTQGQALALARSTLNQARSLQATWTTSQTPDPSMELGDAVYIIARNQPRSAQVLASFAMPFDGGGPMNCTWRALTPDLIEGAS